MGIKVDLVTESRDLPDGVTSVSGYRYELKQGDAVVLSQDTNAATFTFEGDFSGDYAIAVTAIGQDGNPFGDSATATYTATPDDGGQPVGKYDAPTSLVVSTV